MNEIIFCGWGKFATFVLRNGLNSSICRVQKSLKIRRGYYCKVDLVRFATSQIPAPLFLFITQKVAKMSTTTQALLRLIHKQQIAAKRQQQQLAQIIGTPRVIQLRPLFTAKCSNNG